MSSLDKTLLIHALERNEVDKFIVGEQPYFVPAKVEKEEPQNIIQAFDLVLYPYWLATKDGDLPGKIENAFLSLIDNYHDRNRAIYCVITWIWYYKYCESKKIAQLAGYYSNLFELKLDTVSNRLRKALEENRTELIADQRWAGGTWNSDNGMWLPLTRVATVVREKLSGPDFVPSIP